MLHFLFTWRHHYGSYLQMLMLDEDVSHFAIRFNNIVIHQMVNGFEISWYNHWQDTYKVRTALQAKDAEVKEELDIIDSIVRKFNGSDYDNFAWLYFAYCAVMKKFFGKPLPAKNKWQQNSDYLCTSIAELLYKHNKQWFQKDIEDYEILTPGCLRDNLVNSEQFYDVTRLYGKGI